MRFVVLALGFFLPLFAQFPSPSALDKIFSGGVQEKAKISTNDKGKAKSEPIVSTEIPIESILNTHYDTMLKRAFGPQGELYSLGGQEEKPEGDDKYGRFILLLTRGGQSKPYLAIDTKTIYRPSKNLEGKVFTLESTPYEFKYVPRNVFKNPHEGDLYIDSKVKGVPSYVIGIEPILRALYEKALEIQGAPFKIVMFSKYDKDDERCLMVMNKVTEDKYKEFRRFHVEAKELPVNVEGQTPLKVISRQLEGHTFYLGLIERQGKTTLYLRIDR